MRDVEPPDSDRMEVFDQNADMISIIISHHDEAFVGLDVHVLHPREELAEYARLSREHGVKLELETWNTGSIWNLRYLIENGLLDPRISRRCSLAGPAGAGVRRPSRGICSDAASFL